MASSQSLSVLVYIELFVGTCRNINDGILLTCKVYVQKRKKACPFCQKGYKQINYPQLLYPNPRTSDALLNGQVSVLIVRGRHNCKKKKTRNHDLSCKGRL